MGYADHMMGWNGLLEFSKAVRSFSKPADRIATAAETFAEAAKTAAEAYTKKVEQESAPKYIVTVNVNGDSPTEDVTARVREALKAQQQRGVQDR